jgi:RHS repeat-associated protein
MAEGGLDIVYRFTGKERDEETGLYYYGARYLDAKASRWLSTDPALGEYIPGAPVDEEARKRNGNLPGMGGVYNLINLHLYHYAGNNPVKYIDPDGNEIIIAQQKDRIPLLKMINSVSAQKYNVDSSGNLIQDGNKKNSIFGIGRSQEFSDRLQEGIESTSIISLGISDKIPGGSESGKVEEYDVAEGGGGRTSEIFGFVYVRITGKNSPNGIKMKDGSEKTYNPTEILVHELVGHAIPRVTHNNGNAVDKENAVRNEMHWKERDPHAQDDPAY